MFTDKIEQNPHAHIVFHTKSGREISIVQGQGTSGRKGQTVEVWDFTTEDPVIYDLDGLITCLQNFQKGEFK